MSEKPVSAPSTTPLNYKGLLILIVALGLLGWFIHNDPERAWNIAVVVLGFSAVVFVHELGHFVAAKSVGIKCEAFSIGFGPIVVGFQKVLGGLQVKILPSLLPGNQGGGMLGFVIPFKTRTPGETEYRLSLVPLGGFVKMVGQEDVGPDKQSDDPRAFNNKPIWQRAIVVSAGVFMNVVIGTLVFIFVFTRGIELVPPVIGSVAKDRPAEKAGLKAGDEIVELNGKTFLDFTDIMLASAFTGDNEKIDMKVRHPEGGVDSYQISPVAPENQFEKDRGIRLIGVIPADSLILAEPREEEVRQEMKKLGLEPGAHIIAINGQKITRSDELDKALMPDYSALAREEEKTFILTLRQENKENNQITRTVAKFPYVLVPTGAQAGKVMGASPLLQVDSVVKDMPAEQAGISKGDIIAQVGDIPNPTAEEFVSYTRNHAKEAIELRVLRREGEGWQEKSFAITPRFLKQGLLPRLKGLLTRTENRPLLGVSFAPLALALPRVAITEPYDSANPLPLPRGAEITAVGARPVANWQDIIDGLLENKGKKVSLSYRPAPQEQVAQIEVQVPDSEDWRGFTWGPEFGDLPTLPLQSLTRLYKAENFSQALAMGYDRTYVFIAQTYLMIKGMIQGSVSPKSASGPVGILKLSYTIAQQKSHTFYLYFMAIISVCIAVFNFLPFPVLDGGLMVMLLVEKLKGSPVSVRVQGAINYVGLALILMFFLFVTYQDILKVIKDQI